MAGLNEVLHGGLIAERIYLLDGNPGAGKTTLALQYLLEGVRVGEKCLYITLSETRGELIANANSHGWSLEGIEIFELIADDLHADAEGDLTMFHPAEVELNTTTRRMLDKIEAVKPARLVLDSLSELRLLAQSSLRYRRQILGLKQYLVRRQCTVLLLDDRTAEGMDTQLQSIAHGVLTLDAYTPAYGRMLRQLRVVKFRGSDFRSGLHDFVINRGGLTVFPRLSAAEHRTTFTRETVPSGVDSLDALLGGGIDRGTATLVIGPPGTGKSTVALQYAHAAAQRGDHAAIFNFEETAAILTERAAGLGMTLHEGVGPGKIAVRQIDPAEISPGEFVAFVRKAVEVDGARVVVIDSLNGYLNAMPDDKQLTAQLHELLSYLNNHGVATFLIAAQSGMLGPTMRSPVDASYLADSVVVLRMYEHGGVVRKAISVVKKRSGPHEDSIRRLWFDEAGVHLSEPLMHLRGVLTGVPVEVESSESAPAGSRVADAT
ncbi:ATPase domain-containing protein [Piscinibacter sp. HJYY11]|uniref:ATPase domain-containing protein n=1 Tax=Piscinibacter sp. HJYY11 TaxID=2801333 RepID=UPI0028739946|nr:ATPase domain-containing protein [Piscinibacter sp. HJYY11]